MQMYIVALLAVLLSNSDIYKRFDMEEKKPYMIAIIIQVIYTGTFVISKAAFDQGMNTFVFIFYRQAASLSCCFQLQFFLKGKLAKVLYILDHIILFLILRPDLVMEDDAGFNLAETFNNGRKNALSISFRMMLKLFLYALIRYECHVN